MNVDSEWIHNTEASTSDGVVDTMVFEHGTANFIVSAGTADIETAISLMNVPGTVSEIDAGSGYALKQVDAYGIFSVVAGANTHTIIAPVSSFPDAMMAAQAGILVDGAIVMSGVDGVALAGSFAGAGDSAMDASAPLLVGGSSEGVTEEPATAEEDATESSTAALAESDSTAETTTEPPAGENSFVAPISGATVSWSDDWERQWTGTEFAYEGFEDETMPEYSYESFCLVGSTEESISDAVCFFFDHEHGIDRTGIMEFQLRRRGDRVVWFASVWHGGNRRGICLWRFGYQRHMGECHAKNLARWLPGRRRCVWHARKPADSARIDPKWCHHR